MVKKLNNVQFERGNKCCVKGDIMEYWKRTVDYKEYYSTMAHYITNVNKVNESDIKKQGSFTLTSVQLGLGVVKALITKSDVYTKEIITLAKSYLVQFPIILDEDTNHNLRISYTFKNLFRDFSKTTRIGEIAQGLNYVFAQKILNCITIRDFDEYLKDNGLYKGYKGQHPDYVTIYRDKTRGILESKGSILNPTQMMISGLVQCSCGRTVVGAKRAYASAVWFSINGPKMKRNTTLHYIDPEEQNDEVHEAEYRISLLKEFAKWFCIAGLYDVALILSKGEFVTQDMLSKYTSIYSQNDRYLQVNQLAEEVPLILSKQEVSSEKLRIDFGISNSLMQFVTGKADYKEQEEKYENIDNGMYVYESYSDGTWIKIITDGFEINNSKSQVILEKEFER